jgi:hypothetical protein
MVQVSTGIWTADNAWVSVEATVSFDVVDPALLRRTVGHADEAVEETVVWALRDAVGALPLGQALNCADQVSPALPSTLNARTSVFGVRVTRFAVTAIAQAPEPSRDEGLEFLSDLPYSTVLRGYDRGRVDDLMARARHALLHRPDLRATVARELSEPIPVRLRGYDRARVDTLRRLLAAMLAEQIPDGTA